MNEEKIREIQQELKQLSQKQVELSKAHQQQFFLYRWLQGPDPELQSVKDEIADLKEQRSRIYDILQVIQQSKSNSRLQPLFHLL